MTRIVSNRIFMQAIGDAMTVQASLRANITLEQRYSRASDSAIPSWIGSDLSTKPHIYPVVQMNGVLYNIIGVTWRYNEQLITFESPSGSTYQGWLVSSNFTAPNGEPLFLMSATDANKQNVGTALNPMLMPVLVVNGDLVDNGNLNMDSITMAATLEDSGHLIPFAVSTEIRLSELSSSGYMGVIRFMTPSVITSSDPSADGSRVVMTAELTNNAVAVSGFTVNWKVNGDLVAAGATGDIGLSADGLTLTVCEPAITDIAVVECEFVVDDSTVDVQMVTVDDLQDPEYMWVTNYIGGGSGSGQNGTSSVLHRGETVTWGVWMGKSDDSTSAGVDSRYSRYSVRLFNAHGNVLNTDSENPDIADLPTAADGWLELTSSSYGSGRKGVFNVTWEEICHAGGSIEGYVRAEG